MIIQLNLLNLFMRMSGFSAEVAQLLTLVYGVNNWYLWISNNETIFTTTDSSLIYPSDERLYLLQQSQHFPEVPFSLPPSHPFFKYIHHHSSNQLIFQSFIIESHHFVIAVTTDKLTFIPWTIELIHNKLEDWKKRIQIDQLIQRQQLRIYDLESKISSSEELIQQRFKRLLNDWKQTKNPIFIEFSNDIIQSLNPAYTDQMIIQQLDQALELLQYIQPSNTTYLLRPDHLPLDKKSDQVEVPRVLSPNQRAQLLLDKYEAAARLAQQKGLIVNGKTIAEHLQPSISPPAVTDAMKKHRKGIITALHESPDKWELLRKYLKPVKELNDYSFVHQN